MLVEYKGKWFNPELVRFIRPFLSSNTVIDDGVYKRKLCITIYISENINLAIPTLIYCDNQEVDKCRSKEYMDKLAEEDLNKLATFINKHCKENKCQN